MGEERLQTFINFALGYMSNIKLPVKRGTFIEFRTGLINVCPVGRSCSQAEREQFNEYDKEHKIRDTFVIALKEKFPDLGLEYCIGKYYYKWKTWNSEMIIIACICLGKSAEVLVNSCQSKYN